MQLRGPCPPTSAMSTSSPPRHPTSRGARTDETNSTSHQEWSSSTTQHNDSSADTESTPLLAGQNAHGERRSWTKDLIKRRWPSILSLVCLCLVVVLILIGIFIIPEALREYAAEAFVIEPTSLSIESYTENGAVARVQALLIVDSSRVKKKSARDLGRFATYIAWVAETDATRVELSLPEYGEVVVAAASIPKVKVYISDGYTTAIDFLADVQPGVKDGIRRLAEDLVTGKLNQLSIQGSADVTVRSGIFEVSRNIAERIKLDGGDIPKMPAYNVTRVTINETELPNGVSGLKGEATVSVNNPYPLDLTIPSLGFAISIPNCSPSQPNIMLADARSKELHIEPKTSFDAELTAYVRKLSDDVIRVCPNSHQSPLDSVLQDYMHGRETIFYVQGSDSPDIKAPKWLTKLISDIIVPIPFPGHGLGKLIKSFNLAHVNFDLPSFFAPPNSPESHPRITADIEALVALPDEINFPINISRIRTTAEIFYKGDKLGYLDLAEWQDASSKRIDGGKVLNTGLQIRSHIDKAPVVITNQSVFTDVLQALLTSQKSVEMTVKADVDVEVASPLRKLVLKKIPAEGTVPVKPISGHVFKSLAPRLSNMRITNTSKTSMQIDASVNFTNPTTYSASIPFADVNILVNGTKLAHGQVQNITIIPGKNFEIPVRAIWNPSEMDGERGVQVGRELLSQYISGYNTTLTLKAHNETIPSLPELGRALEFLDIEFPTPRIGGPGKGHGGGDKSPHFIEDTTMHLLSSTADFVLRSPFQHNWIFIQHLNATAFYKEDVVGQILYDKPIPVPPGLSESPRLPVSWDLDSIGFDAIRDAVGGALKLSAKAYVVVQIDNFVDRVWYQGHSIGAKIRLLNANE